MTDFMVMLASDLLTRVFLSLRRAGSQGAQAAATELRPYTEQPGQRVPVPRATLLRTELALRQEARSPARRPHQGRLAEDADLLIRARTGG